MARAGVSWAGRLLDFRFWILDFGFWRGPGGEGETWFSHPPARGLRPPRPSRGRGYGGTWFPRFHVRRSCAWRTTPRCTCPGSAGVPPESRLRGHGDSPFPDPPPLGAGTRRLPPAGEAGRGAEPGERWSRRAVRAGTTNGQAETPDSETRLILQRDITCVAGRGRAGVSDANDRRGGWPLASSARRQRPTSGRTRPAG